MVTKIVKIGNILREFKNLNHNFRVVDKVIGLAYGIEIKVEICEHDSFTIGIYVTKGKDCLFCSLLNALNWEIWVREDNQIQVVSLVNIDNIPDEFIVFGED